MEDKGDSEPKSEVRRFQASQDLTLIEQVIAGGSTFIESGARDIVFGQNEPGNFSVRDIFTKNPDLLFFPIGVITEAVKTEDINEARQIREKYPCIVTLFGSAKIIEFMTAGIRTGIDLKSLDNGGQEEVRIYFEKEGKRVDPLSDEEKKAVDSEYQDIIEFDRKEDDNTLVYKRKK